MRATTDPFNTASDDDAFAGGAESGTDWKDLRQKLAIAIVPVLITVAGTVWISQLSRSMDQSTELSKLKAKILDDTSMVSNDLRKARKLLVNQGYAAALPGKAKYAAARDRWYNEQTKLRDQVRGLYGDDVANIVYNRSSSNFVVDRCYVLVARDDRTRDRNCVARLHNEVDTLTARQDAANSGRDYPLAGTGVIVPVDFTKSMGVANDLLERVVDCKKPVAMPSGVVPQAPEARCPDLKYLQYALNLRVNLVGVTQQTLEDAMAKRQ